MKSYTYKSYTYKIGAIFYVLWGLLHIVGASALIFLAYGEGASSVLASVGSNVGESEIPALADGLTASVLAYYAWNLLWVGILVTILGIRFNWRNSRIGYWFNLVIVSAVDGGLVIMLLIPGYMAWSDGLLGIALWIPALIFSTIGLFSGSGQPSRQALAA